MICKHVLFVVAAMKKRDRRLENDEEFYKDTWQLVKESVRQLKHDHNRNTLWKTLRATQTNSKNPPRTQTMNFQTQSDSAILRNDENYIRNP